MAIGVYTAICPSTAFTASRTVVQINAPSSAILKVFRIELGQDSSTTTNALAVQVLRTTTAGTGTSTTPRPLAGYAACATTATYNHTAEGTAGDELFRAGVNVLDGWLWEVPREDDFKCIIVPPSGRLALRLPNAPTASITIDASIEFLELS